MAFKKMGFVIRNIVGDIISLENKTKNTSFDDCNDGSAGCADEMRRYAPIFLKNRFENKHWRILFDDGKVLEGFDYSEALKQTLIDNLPHYEVEIEEF